jgi:2-methylaconitate cis-trans-isomerase PrpF
VNGQWSVIKAVMSRSARVLMEGRVCVPAPDQLTASGDVF